MAIQYGHLAVIGLHLLEGGGGSSFFHCHLMVNIKGCRIPLSLQALVIMTICRQELCLWRCSQGFFNRFVIRLQLCVANTLIFNLLYIYPVFREAAWPSGLGRWCCNLDVK